MLINGARLARGHWLRSSSGFGLVTPPRKPDGGEGIFGCSDGGRRARALLAIYEYISDRASPEIAWGFVRKIEAFCLGLGTAPERGTRRDDLRPGLRTGSCGALPFCSRSIMLSAKSP